MANKVIRSIYNQDDCDCPSDSIQFGSNPSIVDYIDGYPSDSGEFTINVSDFWFDRDEFAEVYREALGLPSSIIGSIDQTTLSFKFGSGIKVDKHDNDYQIWKAYRFDCGCLKYVCGQQAQAELTGTGAGVESTGTGEVGTEIIPVLHDCILDKFYDQSGNFDPHCDKLEIDSKTILQETIGISPGYINDSTLNNSLSLNNAGILSQNIPSSGVFYNFTDDYGVIYSSQWTYENSRIDITTTILDPRIPGQTQQEGKIKKQNGGLRVFRTGIITTIRQIMQISNAGWTLIAEAKEQKVGEFQATFACGDDLTKNPFALKMNNMITDQLEIVHGTNTTYEPENPEEFIWYPHGDSNSFTIDVTQNIPVG